MNFCSVFKNLIVEIDNQNLNFLSLISLINIWSYTISATLSIMLSTRSNSYLVSTLDESFSLWGYMVPIPKSELHLLIYLLTFYIKVIDGNTIRHLIKTFRALDKLVDQRDHVVIEIRSGYLDRIYYVSTYWLSSMIIHLKSRSYSAGRW